MHSSRMRTTRTMTGRISYHACPPFAMHTPPLPCMPPFAMHAPPLPCTPPFHHACPLHHTCPLCHTHPPLPCMPPLHHACQPPCPPGMHTPQHAWSNHTCPPRSNHACPHEQPHMPPLPEQPCMSPRGQTDTCKNITFANFICGR